MGAWASDSNTHVSTMTDGDFRSNEQSATMPAADQLKIVHTDEQGNETVLAAAVDVQAGEIVDATCMNISALLKFIEAEIEDAKKDNVLFHCT